MRTVTFMTVRVLVAVAAVLTAMYAVYRSRLQSVDAISGQVAHLKVLRSRVSAS
jgi:hypothetical protein